MSFRIFADTPRISAAHEAAFHAPATRTTPSSASRRYFTGKLMYASAGHGDVPLSTTNAAPHAGSAKLNATQASAPLRPHIEDGGATGGVRWGALFEGLFFGKPVSPQAGSYHSWHQEGLFFRESGAPQVLADAAIETSDWLPVLAGLGAAPQTGGLSLLVGIGMTAVKKLAKKVPSKTFGAADLKFVREQLVDFMAKEGVLEQRLVRWKQERMNITLGDIEFNAQRLSPSEQRLFEKLKRDSLAHNANLDAIHAQLTPLQRKAGGTAQPVKLDELDDLIAQAGDELVDLKRHRENLEVSMEIVQEGLR